MIFQYGNISFEGLKGELAAFHLKVQKYVYCYRF